MSDHTFLSMHTHTRTHTHTHENLHFFSQPPLSCDWGRETWIGLLVHFDCRATVGMSHKSSPWHGPAPNHPPHSNSHLPFAEMHPFDFTLAWFLPVALGIGCNGQMEVRYTSSPSRFTSMRHVSFPQWRERAVGSTSWGWGEVACHDIDWEHHVVVWGYDTHSDTSPFLSGREQLCTWRCVISSPTILNQHSVYRAA